MAAGAAAAEEAEELGLLLVVAGERRVGRERAGGRRWMSRERKSAAAAESESVPGAVGSVDGVGGGAEVAPYTSGKWRCCLWAEEAMPATIMKGGGRRS